MTDTTQHFDLTRSEPPLETDFSRELISLWESIFQSSFEQTEPILRGGEVGENIDVIYVARHSQQLAATCHLTISGTDPRLGGIGEVAVPTAFRCQGLASMLCELARDEFFSRDGEALFLGTVNPAARRIYERLGWRTIPGSTVMVCSKDPTPPTEFLEQWLRPGPDPCMVRAATSAIRVPIIPLAVADHPWKVLDANAGLYSSRHVEQNSCMGLYARYEEVMREGAVFACWSVDNKLSGLATVRLHGEVARVDGFTRAIDNVGDEWRALIQAVLEWAFQGSTECIASVAAADKAKQQAFHSAGFVEVGCDDDIRIREQVIKMKSFRFGV